MKLFLIILLSLNLTSCFQQSNSSTADGVQVDESEGNAFISAFNVLNAECIQCHSGYHNDWESFTREADWLAEAGLITTGDSDSSFLVERIHGCGASDSGAQMPKDADRLTEAECKAITDWIDGLE